MTDRVQPPAAPQSIGTPPNPPYTPRSTTIPDDSETEFVPTPLHSPGGPQYEDLPPSYNFALSDTRNGVASLDASQIEAHRVSANEGPDEPEVWEYRIRAESAEEEGTHDHEEAPAYEGHIPVQHFENSENIPVGHVRGFSSTPSAGSRGASASEGPLHSNPDSTPNFKGHGRRETHNTQHWTPFGAPGSGPFGAPGSGPFGAPGSGPFGALGNGPFGPHGSGPFGSAHACSHKGWGGRPDSDRHGRRARSGSSQDWAALGQNMGRLGEELGRCVGALGEQIGKQAGIVGQQIGRSASAMGHQVGRGAEGWAAGGWATAPSRPAMASQSTSIIGPNNMATSQPPRYDEPPSYHCPVEVASQQEHTMHSDRKVNSYPPEKVLQSSSKEPPEKKMSKQKSNNDDDDDNSSISSDSSHSSFSSNSEDDINDYDEAQTIFLGRIESINKTAEAAVLKGKKSREEIEHQRDLAIAKATREKEHAQLKFARRQLRRTQQKELRNRKRELTREYRQKRRELRERAQDKGKGKGKAKKGTDWKELKREYKAKRRALKRERTEAKREYRKERREGKRMYKEGDRTEQKVLTEKD